MTSIATTASTTFALSPELGAGSRSRKIVVAMSGGVDSSVAAALLKQAGHDVVGVTLQLYDDGTVSGRKGSCCAGQDIHDARRVADTIGIAHYVLDYERRFADAVMAPFARSYAMGETPIPCAACNQDVKFGPLLNLATDLGAELLATGHYIEMRHGASGPELYRAFDAARDQSYFLFQTSRRQLERLAFPLGHLPKSAVRQAATALALPVADKADSQDICFVPSGSYAGTVQRLQPDAVEPGDIVTLDGNVIGQHKGIIHFTIGQRRGLGVAAGEPLFVVRLDAARRQVVVGPRQSLLVDRLILRDINWIGDCDLAAAVSAGMDVHSRVRSTGALLPGVLLASEDRAVVALVDGEAGVAPGQACVFYSDATDRSRMLGGGWIAETAKAVKGLPATQAPTSFASDKSPFHNHLQF